MSNTPFKDKNSYENYVAHLNQLSDEAKEAYKKFKENSNLDRLHLLTETMVARFRFFDAFYDRYDITDEIFGATIVPVVLGIASIAITLLALWEAGHMLAIKAGMVRNDDKPHSDRAVMYFLAGIAASAFAFVAFFKSVVSIATRTGFTLADGWKNSAKETKDRFYKEKRVKHAGRLVNQFLDELLDTGPKSDTDSVDSDIVSDLLRL